MQPRGQKQRNQALTRIEIAVVIVILAVLILIFVVNLQSETRTARQYVANIACVGNLKQIGSAYQSWASEHNNKFPTEISLTNGGAMELAAVGDVVKTFQLMSNELKKAEYLICPADQSHIAATNFAIGFNDKNISYFTGLDASTNYPQAFLSGDDNFLTGIFPVKSGLVPLSTNVFVAWSATRHINRGTLVMADGSVSQSFNKNQTRNLQFMLSQTGIATNRLAIP